MSSISDQDMIEASTSMGEGGGGGGGIKSTFIDLADRQGKEGSSAFSSEYIYLFIYLFV